MRYKLLVDRLVNQLVPHYLCGRRLILLVQSALHPLQALNDRFRLFTREKHIEARMTSQVIYFEWFLNYRLGKYLAAREDRIFLRDTSPVGVDIYHQAAEHARPFTVWYEGEAVATVRPDEQPRALHRTAEERTIGKVSFMVAVPRITIPQQEFVHMLSCIVNTYRLAGRTYLILIDGEEFEPHTTNTHP